VEGAPESAGSLDVGINLDELTAIAKEIHSEQGCWWHVEGKCIGHRAPGIEQVLVWANHIDREVMNVVTSKAVPVNQGRQVGEAQSGLRQHIVGVRKRAVGIERNLAGHKQAITYDIGVAVARRRR
jgi:hypothetical protein